MEQSWGPQLSLLRHSDTTEPPGKMFRPQDQTWAHLSHKALSAEQGSSHCLLECQRVRQKFRCSYQEHKESEHNDSETGQATREGTPPSVREDFEQRREGTSCSPSMCVAEKGFQNRCNRVGIN